MRSSGVGINRGRRNALSRVASLLSAGALVSVAGTAFAQRGLDAAASGATLPAPRAFSFPEDRQKVFLFFQFGCPFSATLHASAISWARTLPPAITFARIPVVFATQDKPAAIAHSMVRILAPSKLDQFEYSVFDDVAKGSNPHEPEVFTRALRLVGVDPKQYEQRQMQDVIAARVQRMARLGWQYRVEVTPSVAIGGNLLLTPGQVNGDFQQLFQLVGAAVSRLL